MLASQHRLTPTTLEGHPVLWGNPLKSAKHTWWDSNSKPQTYATQEDYTSYCTWDKWKQLRIFQILVEYKKLSSSGAFLGHTESSEHLLWNQNQTERRESDWVWYEGIRLENGDTVKLFHWH